MDFLSLPNELVIQIFSLPQIEIKDLFNLMVSCKQLHNTIQESNELWRQKFLKLWPHLLYIFSNQRIVKWKFQVYANIMMNKKIYSTLDKVSPICYPEREPPLQLLGELLEDQDDLNFHYAEECLLQLIFHQDQQENLTQRFYGRKALSYIRVCELEKSLKNFHTGSNSNQSLIEGAVLISQWGQIEQEKLVKLQDVKAALDAIAQRVIEVIADKHRHLKILSRNELGKTVVETNGNPELEKKVLVCINDVLYREMGFCGNVEDYYNYNNSFIDKVLETKKGIPITLCIIYHEVAKRLGIVCEPVSFPQHFLLKWKEYPYREGKESYTYIDAFNKGDFHLPSSCPALIGQFRHVFKPDCYATIPTIQVMERMSLNLIQCCRIRLNYGRGDSSGLRSELHFYRLANIISPGELSWILTYVELCIFVGIELEEAIHLLQSSSVQILQGNHENAEILVARMRQALSKCQEKLEYQIQQGRKKPVSRRSTTVKLAVGLVMKHAIYEYNCVIVDWDAKCLASDEWIGRMRVHELPRGSNQPFYHVLVDDGTHRYAAEDNLKLTEPLMIQHPDVGRHFQRFDGRRYVPNAEKMAHYPEDEAAVQHILLRKD